MLCKVANREKTEKFTSLFQRVRPEDWREVFEGPAALFPSLSRHPGLLMLQAWSSALEAVWGLSAGFPGRFEAAFDRLLRV